MKKIIILAVVIVLIGGVGVTFSILNKKQIERGNEILKQNEQYNNDNTVVDTYKDDNPIKLGLYKNYGSNKERELIKEFSSPWTYHNNISSFEVYYTTEEKIPGTTQKTLFDEYRQKYENYDKYKIGYNINFLTNAGEVNQTILSPVDTEDFFDYLEVYLYDDYNRSDGERYSHNTEEDFTDNTILTSIKLTAGKKVAEITSDITVTAFTYDNDDFDQDENYRGVSKYSIVVKKQ